MPLSLKTRTPPSDIDRSIDDYDVRVEAARVIEQFSDEDDNQALIK